jgi:hypothetical protein
MNGIFGESLVFLQVIAWSPKISMILRQSGQGIGSERTGIPMWYFNNIRKTAGEKVVILKRLG